MIMIALGRKYFVKTVAILLGLLFMYASTSKMLDFENFQVQLAQSPLLSAYAGFVSYAVIISEVIITVLLCINSTRLIALYASFALMVAFTTYIYLILNYSEFIPCSCGGILEKMGWQEHLIFNILFVLLAAVAIFTLSRASGYKFKNILGLVCITTVLSIGVVVIMFLGSEHIIKKENNFTRRFLNHPVVLDSKVLDLDNPDYYFAGSDDSHIYLGNRIFPQILLTVDTGLKSQQLTKVVPDNMKHQFASIKIQVFPPHYYFYDGSVPVIFKGRLGSENAKTLSLGDAFFNQLVVIDSTRFVLRTQSGNTKEFALASFDLLPLTRVKLYPNILEKQIDGVFDVDGNLTIDRSDNTLIYTYLYRNEFIVMDTNLSIDRRLNTIDTTRIAQIKITKLGDGRHKMNAPPFKVNRQSVAHRGLLFNQSDLMGKHESRQEWKSAKVIDVYRTDKQEYIGSFYIYNKKERKMKDFLLTDNYCYVIMGDEVLRYRIRDNISKHYTKKGKLKTLQ
ncbi:DoxX family protein [Sphingobacterium siyangense]|uniref:DoxX family protein n=1 Tax=Sphingobacterium siyangense TaxID=459529 RepID=UPI001965976F|nr:MauE/DoxX family redox-associated membrane protein [Sphingobacterium siyangense]QRY55918.1 DoxX family protein [Sphingobacterium siyangense]